MEVNAVPSVFLFNVTVPPAFRLTAFKVEITYVLLSCSIVIFPSVLSILPPAPPQVSDESVVPFCFSVTSFFAFISSSAINIGTGALVEMLTAPANA